MADKFWKAVERRIAKLFGTERIGAKNGNCQPDAINDWLTIEVVCHDVPKWIRAEHQQAIDAAYRMAGKNPDYHLPILVIHEKGESESTDLVVLRLSDFVDWFGSVGPLKIKNEEDGLLSFTKARRGD
jgi:hypothetical protein